MKTIRVIGRLIIPISCILCIAILSCSHPLESIKSNSPRALEYSIPADPDPIGNSQTPLSVPLIAGKSIEIGTVDTWLEEDVLYVSFNSQWQLIETHLDIVLDPMDFPQTKKGNPKPGHFEYKTTHAPGIYVHTYQIPINIPEETEMLFFAAHAAVEEWLDDDLINSESAWAFGYEFPGANWATYFVGAIPEVGPEDGTVTVQLSDFPMGSGHQSLIGLFYHNSDPTDMNNFVAMGGFEIVDGAGSDVLGPSDASGGQENPPSWIGAGGEMYDLYFWVDLNDNFDFVQYPEQGIDDTALVFPIVVTVDGNINVYLTGDDIGKAQPF